MYARMLICALFMGIKAPRTYPADGFARAACRGADPELFFAPDREGPARRLEREQAAKAICATCEIRDLCLSWALGVNEHEGVWGGLSEDERRALRRSVSRKGSRVAVA